MRPLIFDIIMQIPPLVPSGELRVSLLLRVTADLLDSVHQYPAFIPIPEDFEGDEMSTSGTSAASDNIEGGTRKYPLVDLFDMFTDLDNAWAAVLMCQVWNNETKRGEDVIIAAPDTPMDKDLGTESLLRTSKPPEQDVKLYAPSATDCTRLRSMILSGISAIEDWLDESQAPHTAREPFEECFDLTLRMLGDDSNQAMLVQDGFVPCSAGDGEEDIMGKFDM